MATLAPSCDSRMAACRPMPEAPPVMSAIFPATLSMGMLLSACDGVTLPHYGAHRAEKLTRRLRAQSFPRSIDHPASRAGHAAFPKAEESRFHGGDPRWPYPHAFPHVTSRFH